MLDILIKNGKIIDGSGAPAYNGAIGIKDGKLVSAQGTEQAAEVIDAAGRVVCPGFIDAHSHGDRPLGTEDGRLFKTPQGITTELCGQCGASRAPLTLERLELVKTEFKMTYPEEEIRRWTTFENYLDWAQRQAKSANAKFYVGHKMLRYATMGPENREPTRKEQEHMEGMLREAMEAGAAGMTTGLVYPPSCYSTTEELVNLMKVAAPFNGIYASHMRNESARVVEAVEETINIGRLAGVRVDVSHHKVMGKPYWGKHRQTLELIRKANEEEGIHVTCDQYPYPRNMTSLKSCIPPWHFSEGTTALARRLSDPALRARIRKEIEDPATAFENFYLNSGGWSGVFIANMPNTPEAGGMFITEYAEKIGKDVWDTFFDLLEVNECIGGAVYCTISEDDMCDVISSPYCVIGTDGISRAWTTSGHPRSSASFPQAIDFYVRQRKVLTLEEMIHKMTGLTADRLLVPNKGLLKPGYDADVLILDYENMKVHATYTDPHRKTDGIDYVIVNGQIVYKDLEFTGIYSGKVVRHPR